MRLELIGPLGSDVTVANVTSLLHDRREYRAVPLPAWKHTGWRRDVPRILRAVQRGTFPIAGTVRSRDQNESRRAADRNPAGGFAWNLPGGKRDVALTCGCRSGAFGDGKTATAAVARRFRTRRKSSDRSSPRTLP